MRIEPSGAPLEIESRAYRGALEVFGNARHTLTVVNELPLEEYLRGVVPNELSPTTFGQIEALKAQAVAARTYIQRNLGQYKNEGYDICATDACQVYFGAQTEDPLATQAVVETRGVVATYDGKPINALYSSTCGGRTEDAENIFDEKVPYLVSTSCEYKHPRPLPFASSRSVPNWKDGVLAVARRVELRRRRALHGPAGPRRAAVHRARRAGGVHPADVLPVGDDRRPIVSFVTEQGILPPAGSLPTAELLFRLIDKKSAFEWQQGVLVVLGRAEDAAHGERPAEGVRARPGRAHLPAHRRRARGDAPGLVDRRRAGRLPRRGRHDPDAGLPDQLRESRGRSLFAPGHVAGAQDPAGARCRVQVAGDRRLHGHARRRARTIGASRQHGDRRLERPPDRARASASHAARRCATACSRSTSSGMRAAPSSA